MDVRADAHRVSTPSVTDPQDGMSGAPVAGSRRRVLIADDNQDSADSLGEVLRLMGYDVRTAWDGLEALVVAREFRPDCVILDLAMPRLNGFDVASLIRREPWGAKTTLLAVTGWNDDERRRRAIDSGFSHYLLKPVDPAVYSTLLGSPDEFPEPRHAGTPTGRTPDAV